MLGAVEQTLAFGNC